MKRKAESVKRLNQIVKRKAENVKRFNKIIKRQGIENNGWTKSLNRLIA